MTKHRKIVALILALALLVSLVGCRRETFVTQAVTKFTGLFVDNRTDQVALTVQGHSTQTSNLFVLEQSDGTDVLTVDNDGAIGSAGAVTFEDDVTITLDAAQNVLIDASTTAHTETDGALDVNMATITADVSAVNIAATTNDGATAAEDAFAMVVTLTQDDADGDLFGISMTAAASTNAAAGSYEAGFVYACAENTSGACLDGIRLTAAGHATGMTDGLDASHTGIVNAVNIGSNLVLGGNADTFTLGATDHHFIVIADEAATVTFMGADNATPADTAFDTTGAGTVTIGSADVTNVTVNSDVGLTFANNSESIYDGTDATFDFTRNDSGTVIITASDDDATAALTIDSGGAADLTLGSADATGVDLVANGNMDITIGGATDYIFKANEFEVQAGSVINHSSGTNEGVVWICEKAVSHTDVETTVTMCVIPANANIVDVTFTVETQWNDGVSAVIDCGINAGDVDAYVDNHNINDAADVNRTGDNADMPFLTALGDVGGSAITVDCTIDEGNVDANAGAATLRIFYFLD